MFGQMQSDKILFIQHVYVFIIRCTFYIFILNVSAFFLNKTKKIWSFSQPTNICRQSLKFERPT